MTAESGFASFLRPLAAAAVVLSSSWCRAADKAPLTYPYSSLMIISPEGQNLREVYSQEKSYVGSPQWSPDGRFVAFDYWLGGEEFQDAKIRILDVSAGTTQDLGPGAMPGWSPDGKQLVCHTYRDDGRDIVVMNLSGKGREVILDHWGSPRWSPEGSRIISANFAGISVFELQTGVEHIVAAGIHPWQGLSISPDGTQICFSESSHGVYLAQLSSNRSSATVTTIAHEGESSHSCFSPDGKRIVFNWKTKFDAHICLYVYDLENKGPPTLLPGQDLACGNSSPTWSPDGTAILYVSQNAPTDLNNSD